MALNRGCVKLNVTNDERLHTVDWLPWVVFIAIGLFVVVWRVYLSVALHQERRRDADRQQSSDTSRTGEP